jgi:Smg protein
MQHTVIDVLIYIFEHYAEDDVDILDDHDRLQRQLREVGFEVNTIRDALDWLNELAMKAPESDLIVDSGTSVRCYSREEQFRLDPTCRGFLHYLEANGVLEFSSRELIIERVMALDVKGIDVEQLKWIVLMVLFNLPGYENAYFSMEDLVNDSAYSALH